MPVLPDSQARFAAALRDPGAAPPESVDPADRFAVYRNNIAVSLVDALAETFPVVRRLVGDEFFRAMAGEFWRADPPRSPVLHEYGDSFPPFIQAFAPAAGLPYLADVASLEWAWQRAYHAADARPLTAEQLAAVPQAQTGSLRIRLHPATQMLNSRWPMVSIWTTNTRDEQVRPIDLQSGGEAALITRPEASVRVHAVSTGALTFTRCLQDGETLGAAARSAANGHDAFDLAQVLAMLLRAGALASAPPADAFSPGAAK